MENNTNNTITVSISNIAQNLQKQKDEAFSNFWQSWECIKANAETAYRGNLKLIKLQNEYEPQNSLTEWIYSGYWAYSIKHPENIRFWSAIDPINNNQSGGHIGFDNGCQLWLYGPTGSAVCTFCTENEPIKIAFIYGNNKRIEEEDFESALSLKDIKLLQKFCDEFPSFFEAWKEKIQEILKEQEVK